MKAIGAESGFVSGAPKLLLRLEGAALMAAALFYYAQAGGDWGRFALLFLAPDLSLFAYLAGPRPGAILYNIAHTTIGPLAYGALGAATGQPLLMQLAAIHLAHIGFDRLLGFGLKYGVNFSATHLGPVGRAASRTASLQARL
ncbi:DUF4260 domain-containing protein [Methylocystis sp. MJC1]|jgi:hypothetical protein|uniref:DUF4260 domain-containing protein n=1 Tax=Methylocystis sp. MJC1 TaxID=2654282 RepID=UPI0013ECA4A2|nr:DUF4260 domain-containing protein [Methylocystis sp. MJC1]KAF2989540.1 hypothetical protein MJC1_03306 [Methylocystis sp. MJC1]MBU6528546.1 DUF4260 domain-containing protein [Methylocystis sp. MJC1]UZX11441.1 DUF4260 domain-containing protein [Methylocystis sp. MJC1]